MLTKEEIKKVLVTNNDVLRKFKVNRLGLFGSYVKGSAKTNSDVDLLIDFTEVIDLFEYVHLQQEIQKMLNKKVDLAMPETLKPRIKKSILQEVEWIEKL